MIHAPRPDLDVFKATDDPASMIPADEGKSLAELVRIALYNIDKFDARPIRTPAEVKELSKRYTDAEIARLPPKPTPREASTAWLAKKGEPVRRLAVACPLNRIYRVKGGLASELRGTAPIGLIISYRDPGRGAPAEAAIIVLGKKSGLGSAERPLVVTQDGLEDITDAARAGKLPELSNGSHR